MTDVRDFRGIAVLGLGRSGRPAALLARRRLPDARVWAIDEGDVAGEVRAELEAAGAAVLAGADVAGAGGAALPAAVDLLVKSPGVTAGEPGPARGAPPRPPGLERGRARLPASSSCRLIGITGTNGKTTTTTLTGRIVRGGRPAGGGRRQHRPRRSPTCRTS